ncbi:MAG: sigma-70 family RNA polymerase sigma factor [Planctomycetota bacterium]
MAESFSVEDLLSNTDWLRVVARGLLRDGHDVDDLVQESVWKALSAPPRSGLALRAWLRRVMLHRLRQDVRNRRTQARLRAGLARPLEVPSTLDLVERTEIQSKLIQALLTLEEPYRTTILRRYYEGCAAGAIARADGVPESTVRTRIQRGLARLRERLRAAHQGDDLQWLPAVAALARPGRVLPVPTVVLMSKLPKLLALAGLVLGLGLVGLLIAPFGARTPPGHPLAEDDRGAETPVAAFDGERGREPDVVADRTAVGASRLAPGTGCLVEVRHANGPLAVGATVAFATQARAQRDNDARGGPSHPHSDVYRLAYLAETFGERCVTDAQGRAWVPTPASRLLLAGWHKESYGTATVAPGDAGPVTLRLWRDETLRLRTVNAVGERQGRMPLRVAVRIDGHPDNTLWTGVSDEHGQVAVRHFQLLRPDTAPNDDPLYGVCLDFPVSPHVRELFREPLPSAPVSIEVPPIGRLQIGFLASSPRSPTRSRWRDAEPLSVPVEYYRLLVDFGRDRPTQDLFPDPVRHVHGRFPDAGEHRAEWPIGLGATVTGTGKLVPVGDVAIVEPVAGPGREGERTEANFVLQRDVALVRGSLVLPPGEAIGPISLRTVLLQGSQQVEVRTLPWPKIGAFSVPMRALGSESPQRGPAAIYVCARPESGGEYGGSAPLRRSSEPAIWNAGAIRLRVLPPTVRGHVLDERGRPVVGATVTGHQPRGEEWIRDRRFVAEADREGRFVMHAEQLPLGYALKPRCTGYLAGPPTPWSATTVLAMVRAASIAGAAELPAEVPSGALVADIQPGPDSLAAGRPGSAPSPRVIALEPTTFRARRLWPGRYRIVLRVRGEPTPIWDFGMYLLQAGDAVTLPPVDLRQTLHVMSLRATDASGTTIEVPGASVMALYPNATGNPTRRIVLWRKGHAELVSSKPELEIEFVARGYRALRTKIGPGANTVRLVRER